MFWLLTTFIIAPLSMAGPIPEQAAQVAHPGLSQLSGGALPEGIVDGKVVLYVNVASHCGLTPQYEQLQKLFTLYKDRGFVVVGVPCNQFGNQEPGDAETIASFCTMNYGVEFPLLSKQEVNGEGRSPLYQWLVDSEAGGGADIGWNFEKFLVDRSGEVVARFTPQTTPDDPALISALEAALGKAQAEPSP